MNSIIIAYVCRAREFLSWSWLKRNYLGMLGLQCPFGLTRCCFSIAIISHRWKINLVPKVGQQKQNWNRGGFRKKNMWGKLLCWLAGFGLDNDNPRGISTTWKSRGLGLWPTPQSRQEELWTSKFRFWLWWSWTWRQHGTRAMQGRKAPQQGGEIGPSDEVGVLGEGRENPE